MLRTHGFGIALLSAVTFTAVGCSTGSSASGGSTAPTVTISGKLATGTVSLTLAQQLANFRQAKPSPQAGTLSLANYGVRCVTLASTPQAGEGTCDSQGNFSLALASATNVPIGCFVISGSGASASIVATLAFESTTTGLDGGNTRSGSYVAGSGTSGLTMGTITLDVDKGLAVVPEAQVTPVGGTTGTVSGTFADMTGDWTIHALATVPTGYVTAGSGNDGPTDGQVIHMGYYSATDASSDVHHGLSIWKDAASLTACGGEGVTLPSGWTDTSTGQALTHAMNVSTTFPLPTAVHISCYQGQAFAGLPTSSCAGATSGNDWQATAYCSHLITDVTYSDGTTWANSSCPANDSTCASVNAHWGMTPVKAAFQCMLNGVHQAAGSCSGDVNIDWAGLWGTTSSPSDPFSGIGWSGSAWTGLPSANTTNNDSVTYFNGHIRFDKNPKDRFMMNELLINGTVGSLTDHHDYTDSACTTTYNSNGGCGGTMVSCHVSENNKLTITQIDSTHANVELVQVKQVSATDDQACTTDTHITARLGQQKWMFAITK